MALYGETAAARFAIAEAILRDCLDRDTGEFIPPDLSIYLRGSADPVEVLREVLWWISCGAEGEEVGIYTRGSAERSCAAYYDEKARSDGFTGD